MKHEEPYPFEMYGLVPMDDGLVSGTPKGTLEEAICSPLLNLYLKNAIELALEEHKQFGRLLEVLDEQMGIDPKVRKIHAFVEGVREDE